MDINELGREITGKLTPVYGAGEARAMMRLMFFELKGWDTTQLVINGDRPASEWLVDRCREIASRAAAGEPIQYLLGRARFYGLDLKVAPGVLIPRPETEGLVDLIVAANPMSDLRVLDVGTGSGAIVIALARNLRFPEITALDVSPQALAIARENAASLRAKISFVQADIFTWNPPPDSFDVIVSNPPYVTNAEKAGMERNVLDHEPPLALFVPDDNPLVYYSRIAEVGAEALAAGGRLYFEINPLYADELKAMLEKAGYADVSLTPDVYGRVRYASAIRP